MKKMLMVILIVLAASVAVVADGSDPMPLCRKVVMCK